MCIHTCIPNSFRALFMFVCQCGRLVTGATGASEICSTAFWGQLRALMDEYAQCNSGAGTHGDAL